MSSQMRSVAIVGAGPAGLVAAKTLLHHLSSSTSFDVTIFEKKSRIGGMWAVEKGGKGDRCSPEMRTNLSRFTVAFSDFAWTPELCMKNDTNLVHQSLKDEKTGETVTTIDEVPMFPEAWMVGDYLKAYAEKFISMDVIKLNCEVIKADLVPSEDDAESKWNIEWEESNTEKSTRKRSKSAALFDYLIIASGFFAAPRTSNATTDSGIQSLHSSQYRDLSSINFSTASQDNCNIVVIGGSMSGIECAATITSQLSDQRWSPSSTLNDQKALSKYKVHHITSRPFHVMPRYLPLQKGLLGSDDPSVTSFLPLDLILYDLSRRPEKEINPINGIMQEERAKKTHAYLSQVCGGDSFTATGNEALSFKEEDKCRPAYVGVSDTYIGFVREGDIMVHRGRTLKQPEVSAESFNPHSMSIGKSDGSIETIDNVLACIHGTGFTAKPSLAFFSESVLRKLDYDASCERIPVLLEQHTTFAPKVPELAFVGFYEGPYWGVMEMQSRMIAQKWTNLLDPPSQSKSRLVMPEVRHSLRSHMQNVPQFWMGDYVGLLDGLARQLDIPRSQINSSASSASDQPSGPAIPARYTTSPSASAKVTLENLKATLAKSVNSKRFIAIAAFTGLHGRWRMRRTITSFLPGFPSGTLEGTAWFHYRKPTDQRYRGEYLYVEEGTLKLAAGVELRANKRYVYRYSERTDKLSAWFVKADDGLSVDYFFNEADFGAEKSEGSKEMKEGKQCVATGAHLCEEDMYDSRYEFHFDGARLDRFSIKYVVKGPKKDYISETCFQR
jgi:cation diffusion facilitator CzcD-associated flavoprotein CzcO